MVKKQESSISDRRYILVDRDGDYVQSVTSTGLETVKVAFHFTKKREEAKEYAFNDILSPLQTDPIGTEFIRGFCGRVERVK